MSCWALYSSFGTFQLDSFINFLMCMQALTVSLCALLIYIFYYTLEMTFKTCSYISSEHTTQKLQNIISVPQQIKRTQWVVVTTGLQIVLSFMFLHKEKRGNISEEGAGCRTQRYRKGFQLCCVLTELWNVQLWMILYNYDIMLLFTGNKLQYIRTVHKYDGCVSGEVRWFSSVCLQIHVCRF